MPVRDSNAESGVPVDYGSRSELLARFDSYHDELVHTLADITDQELDTLSIYWEDEPVDIRFRLYRFAWHLRGHTLQAEKIRTGLGHRMTDADRLIRLLYSALGDAEGALIGAGESQDEAENAVAASTDTRVNEVSALARESTRAR